MFPVFAVQLIAPFPLALADFAQVLKGKKGIPFLDRLFNESLYTVSEDGKYKWQLYYGCIPSEHHETSLKEEEQTNVDEEV